MLLYLAYLFGLHLVKQICCLLLQANYYPATNVEQPSHFQGRLIVVGFPRKIPIYTFVYCLFCLGLVIDFNGSSQDIDVYSLSTSPLKNCMPFFSFALLLLIKIKIG